MLDNVLFPLKMMKRDHARQPAARAKSLLKLVGLEGFEGKYPRELSGGMQMRAGICRALVHDPDILLMDEPFGSLDALTREELTLELMRIWREQPKTVLFVTHSIPESVMLADRVVVLSPRPGRIAEIVPVDVPRPRQFGMEALDEFQRAASRIRQLIFGAARGPPRRPLKRRPLPAWFVEVVLPIAAIAALFLVWEAACRFFAVPSYIIPAPSAIWTETSAMPGNVAWHTLVTTKTVLLGFHRLGARQPAAGGAAHLLARSSPPPSTRCWC